MFKWLTTKHSFSQNTTSPHSHALRKPVLSILRKGSSVSRQSIIIRVAALSVLAKFQEEDLLKGKSGQEGKKL